MSSIGYPVAGNWATDATQVGALSAGLGALTSSALKLQNTRNLQAVLDQSGDLRIVTPGVYEFDVSAGPMTFPSNTQLYIGAGVTLRVANGSPSALFTNATARGAPVTMSGANVTYANAPDGANYVGVVTNMTAAQAAQFPVNSWISVVTLGHGLAGAVGTSAAGRGYRGVWKVVQQTINGATSSIRYEIDLYYPGSNNPTAPVLIYQANENVGIWGPGTIDGNGANSLATFNTGDPRGTVVWWRHAVNVVMQDLNWRRGRTWTLGSNYVRNYYPRRMTCELNRDAPFATVDFIHLSGYHRTVRVQDNSGGSGDNFIGMTIDVTDVASGAANPYDFPFQQPGDMYDIKIEGNTGNSISAESPGTFGIVAMYGPAAYRYFDVEITGLRGQGSAGVQLSNYAQTNQNLLTIGSLILRDISVLNGSQVEFTAGSVYAIDTFSANSITIPTDGQRGIRAYSTCTGTIREMVVNNMATSPIEGAYTRTLGMVFMGGLTINNFSMRNTEGVLQAINTHVVSRDGNGTIGKISFVDVSATGSGTGALMAALWLNTGNVSIPAIQYTRSRSNGVAL